MAPRAVSGCAERACPRAVSGSRPCSCYCRHPSSPCSGPSQGQRHSCALCAEDTSTLCSGNTIEVARERAQHSADALVSWARRDKIGVAGQKTQLLVLSHNRYSWFSQPTRRRWLSHQGGGAAGCGRELAEAAGSDPGPDSDLRPILPQSSPARLSACGTTPEVDRPQLGTAGAAAPRQS